MPRLFPDLQPRPTGRNSTPTVPMCAFRPELPPWTVTSRTLGGAAGVLAKANVALGQTSRPIIDLARTARALEAYASSAERRRSFVRGAA